MGPKNPGSTVEPIDSSKFWLKAIFLQFLHPFMVNFHSVHKMMLGGVSEYACSPSDKHVLLVPSIVLMGAFSLSGINKIHTPKCSYNITLTTVKIMLCRLKIRLTD